MFDVSNKKGVGNELALKEVLVDVVAEADPVAEIFEKSAVIGWFLGKHLSRMEIGSWVEKHWGEGIITNFLPKGFFVAVMENKLNRD